MVGLVAVGDWRRCRRRPLAETMNFKLLPHYSRATFKSDAPLETFVGHTADAACTATLTVDPAKPQDGEGHASRST